MKATYLIHSRAKPGWDESKVTRDNSGMFSRKPSKANTADTLSSAKKPKNSRKASQVGLVGGAVAGGAIGGMVGGPLGVAVGAYVGSAAGVIAVSTGQKQVKKIKKKHGDTPIRNLSRSVVSRGKEFVTSLTRR